MTKNSGTVEIHGRIYETVASRVQKFRAAHESYTLKTDIKRLDDEMVVMEAQILDESGRLIANGHAQEFRQSSQINRTSYVENCETSAIGRALAALGFGGTEFATADELANAINNKQPPQKITPTAGVFESLSTDMQNHLLDIAHRVSSLLKRGDLVGAWDELTSHDKDLNEDGKVGLWAQFDSKERAALKKECDSRKQKEAA